MKELIGLKKNNEDKERRKERENWKRAENRLPWPGLDTHVM